MYTLAGGSCVKTGHNQLAQEPDQNQPKRDCGHESVTLQQCHPPMCIKMRPQREKGEKDHNHVVGAGGRIVLKIKSLIGLIPLKESENLRVLVLAKFFCCSRGTCLGVWETI